MMAPMDGMDAMDLMDRIDEYNCSRLAGNTRESGTGGACQHGGEKARQRAKEKRRKAAAERMWPGDVVAAFVGVRQGIVSRFEGVARSLKVRWEHPNSICGAWQRSGEKAGQREKEKTRNDVARRVWPGEAVTAFGGEGIIDCPGGRPAVGEVEGDHLNSATATGSTQQNFPAHWDCTAFLLFSLSLCNAFHRLFTLPLRAATTTPCAHCGITGPPTPSAFLLFPFPLCPAFALASARLFVLSFITLFLLTSCTSVLPRGNRMREGHGTFAVGTFEQLDERLLQHQLAKPTFGGVLVIRQDGRQLYQNAFGYESDEPKAHPVIPETLFDVASLTKPLVGVPMMLLARRTDAPPLDRRILNHTAGFSDQSLYKPLLAEARGEGPTPPLPNALPNTPKGQKLIYRYSNAGYASQLRWIDRAKARDLMLEMNTSLGAPSFAFNPASEEPTACSGYSAERLMLRGAPYDPLAAAQVTRGPGLALHSGLFAAAPDVARAMDLLMEEKIPERLRPWHDALFSTASEFVTPEGVPFHVTDGGLLSSGDAPYGRSPIPPGRFLYHTGYTGCLLWIDPPTQTVVVLLTNSTLTKQRDEFDILARDLTQTIIRGLTQ